MKKRIWELDAFRGICILGMVLVHAVYDMVELYGIVRWEYPPAFSLIKDWGGLLFILLSGTCATLGSRSVRRGSIVLGCGVVCSLVTWGMARFGFSDQSVIIRFGVLHCLGLCMLLWPMFKKCPAWVLALIGAVLALCGLFLVRRIQTNIPWLFPLGICAPGFSSSDYFPLLPHLGFFLLGGALGKALYRDKTSLLPQVREPRFLCFCGRQSLFIYLLHQPALALIFYVVTLLL